ncbi:hypothetical protein ABM074_22605, partial [Morganella morganii]
PPNSAIGAFALIKRAMLYGELLLHVLENKPDTAE